MGRRLFPAAMLLLIVPAAAVAATDAPALIDCSEPLEALSAHLEDGRLYVELQGSDGPVQAVADLTGLDDAPGVGPRRRLFDLHPASADTGNGTPALAGLPIQGIAAWRAVRHRFLDGILRPGSRDAVAVSFPADDYLLYFDEEGAFQVDPLRAAPEGYRLAGIMDMEALLGRGIAAVRDSLGAAEPVPPRLLLSTGDTGPGALSFVYAELDADRVAFLRCPTPAGAREPPNRWVQGVRTVAHLVRSHFLDLLPRPVSSVHRGFFMLTGAAVDTLRPDWPLLLSGRPVPPVADREPMDLDAFETRLDRITGREATRGTIEYLIDGEPYFTRLIASILAAEESIKLRTYIFDNDDYAKQIADLLKQRSREGIDVQVLLDGLGTLTAGMEDPDTLPVAHEPPASVQRYLEEDSEVDVRTIPNIFLTGDHVKTVIIDHEIAFTGGMNIGREYRYEWHDLMAELRGPVVDTLRWEFDRTWVHAGWSGDIGYVVQRAKPNRRLAGDQGHPLRVIQTRAAHSEIFAAQLEAIRRARSYIYIENAYFSDDTMLFELLQARLRGVDVRVIIPLETDRGLITRDNALAANVMLEHGIRVYIYPGMSHVKAAVYDGWACFGSANFDRLSLRINKEINVATSQPEAVERLLAELFEPDFARSRELTEPFPERWLDHLVELFGDYVF
ncbi:phospholipase D-like domain-containing protein [Lentisalinibacter salinarum]|uniref:phospholipase D-like domain-containing protein n=1 Tax=Lentisalinibacter salinarum TaxID=2992239 RepID=UPI003866D112